MGKKKRKGLCAYCGTLSEALTVDHVIPQCIFPEPGPSDLPKVYACETCNGTKKSLDDSYLRDLLVIDHRVADHPIAHAKFGSKFLSAARQGKSPVARAALKAQLVPFTTQSGIIVGVAREVLLPKERVGKVLATIVRGLSR